MKKKRGNDGFCCACKNQMVPADKYPCLFCVHGSGRRSKNFFAVQKYVLTKSDIEEAVERLKKM